MRRIIVGTALTLVLAVAPLGFVLAKENQGAGQGVVESPTVTIDMKQGPKDKNTDSEITTDNSDKEKPKIEENVTPIETVQPVRNENPNVKEEEVTYKVTLCHRTNSATNPYEKITVSVDAAGNFKDNGNGDHAIHTGPVATSLAVANGLKDSHTDWGDIIPPGEHNTSLNWSAAGQAMFNNGCNFVTTPGEEEEVTHKVTLCHGTNSVTNPYVKITVSVDAAGNFKDSGNGDHAQHTGPVATSQTVAQSLKDQKIQWGDIIPTGPHNTSLNWNAQGQAIFNNDCKYVTPGQGTTNPPKPVVDQSTPQPGSGSVPAPAPVVSQQVASGIGTVEMLPDTSSSTLTDSVSTKLMSVAILAAVTTVLGVGAEVLHRRYNLV